jgi:hypothetical protein
MQWTTSCYICIKAWNVLPLLPYLHLGLKVAFHNDTLVECKLPIPRMPWPKCFPDHNLFHLVIEKEEKKTEYTT